MIKNKNLQMGLLVFVITLIGLIVFTKLYPIGDIKAIDNQIENTDLKISKNLDIAIK